MSSKLETITFEEGIKLNVIDQDSFMETNIKRIKLPILNIKYDYNRSIKGVRFINKYWKEDIVCPVTSIPAIDKQCLRYRKINLE